MFEALTGNLRNFGQLLQLGIMMEILGAAAYLLAGYAGNGLSSLQDAKTAMSNQASN
jgi:hypothetical protein